MIGNSGNTLFIMGGYGWCTREQRFTTFPILIAIDIASTVRAVLAQDSLALTSTIRYVMDSRVQVAGGGAQLWNDWTFLVFGALSNNRYDQVLSPFFLTHTKTQ
jgi:hypothetical protein